MINLGYFLKIFTEKGTINKIAEETTKKDNFLLTLINSILLQILFLIYCLFDPNSGAYYILSFLVSVILTIIGIWIVEFITIMFLNFDKLSENKDWNRQLAVTNYYLMPAFLIYNLIEIISRLTEARLGVSLLFLFAIVNYMNYRKIDELNPNKENILSKIVYALGVCISYFIWLVGIFFINVMLAGGLNG